MDGAHDLGGMRGFGPVPIESDEPLFHERWEGRVWAMHGTVVSRTTIDRFRSTIEAMPAADYLASSYYERWLWALERLADEQRIVERDTRPPPVPRPAVPIPTWTGRYRRGQSVRVRNPVATGHTRVPRYLREHVGTVEDVAFAWPNPGESAATGRYGEPELVYRVAFAAADLFGPPADHVLTADVGESDLEDP